VGFFKKTRVGSFRLGSITSTLITSEPYKTYLLVTGLNAA